LDYLNLNIKAMAANKTTETANSVPAFIETVEDETKRGDCYQLVDLMKTETGFEPKLWGPSIIGFGIYNYKYPGGHSGSAPLAGFAPRKDSIVLYLSAGTKQKELSLQKLGKHKAGKACIYIKKLADIDIKVLREMVSNSVRMLKTQYPN
jgi:hypothetical protein